MELAKEKRGHFLYGLFCPKGSFLTFAFCLNVQCIEYPFRIYSLLHIKRMLLHTLFLPAFKIVKSLQCIINGHVGKRLDLKFRQLWTIITTHLLPNVSRNKCNDIIKFGQLIEHNILFLKNHAEDEARRVVADLFLSFKKLYIR